MFFKTRDDLFLFLEHGKYEKYLSEFMEQQKQIKEIFKNIQTTLYDL